MDDIDASVMITITHKFERLYRLETSKLIDPKDVKIEFKSKDGTFTGTIQDLIDEV